MVENVVMCGKYSCTKFANFLIIVLRAEIVTIFEPKVVAISARTTIMRKFANFVQLYFPHITIFFNQILEFTIVWICLDQKLVYNANYPLNSVGQMHWIRINVLGG